MSYLYSSKSQPAWRQKLVELETSDKYDLFRRADEREIWLADDEDDNEKDPPADREVIEYYLVINGVDGGTVDPLVQGAFALDGYSLGSPSSGAHGAAITPRGGATQLEVNFADMLGDFGALQALIAAGGAVSVSLVGVARGAGGSREVSRLEGSASLQDLGVAADASAGADRAATLNFTSAPVDQGAATPPSWREDALGLGESFDAGSGFEIAFSFTPAMGAATPIIDVDSFMFEHEGRGAFDLGALTVTGAFDAAAAYFADIAGGKLTGQVDIEIRQNGKLEADYALTDAILTEVNLSDGADTLVFDFSALSRMAPGETAFAYDQTTLRPGKTDPGADLSGPSIDAGFGAMSYYLLVDGVDGGVMIPGLEGAFALDAFALDVDAPSSAVGGLSELAVNFDASSNAGDFAALDALLLSGGRKDVALIGVSNGPLGRGEVTRIELGGATFTAMTAENGASGRDRAASIAFDHAEIGAAGSAFGAAASSSWSASTGGPSDLDALGESLDGGALTVLLSYGETGAGLSRAVQIDHFDFALTAPGVSGPAGGPARTGPGGPAVTVEGDLTAISSMLSLAQLTGADGRFALEIIEAGATIAAIRFDDALISAFDGVDSLSFQFSGMTAFDGAPTAYDLDFATQTVTDSANLNILF